jgi:hypothetical protein
MRTHRRWAQNWRIVAPENAVLIDVPRSRTGRRRARRLLDGLPSGTSVVLVGHAAGARRRCRRLARVTGVRLTREYVALPSGRAPAYLVEDAPGTWRYVLSALLTIPPSPPVRTASTEALLRVTRRLSAWNGVGALAPGRVAIGRCR